MFGKTDDTIKVLTKLNGTKIGSKHVAIRYANHINPEEYEKPKPKVEIPVLAAGSSNKSSTDKMSKIKQLEERLKQLEEQQSSNDDLIITNASVAPNESPLIKKYQFNKVPPQSAGNSGSSHYKSKFLSNKKHVKRKQY